MKQMKTTHSNPRCINCAFCGMYDATCMPPLNDFQHIDYEAPACKHFEPEQI
jgi:hypothetical protein